MAMAKGKTPGYDGILVELFQRLWSTIGKYFHQILSLDFSKVYDKVLWTFLFHAMHKLKIHVIFFNR